MFHIVILPVVFAAELKGSFHFFQKNIRLMKIFLNTSTVYPIIYLYLPGKLPRIMGLPSPMESKKIDPHNEELFVYYAVCFINFYIICFACSPKIKTASKILQLPKTLQRQLRKLNNQKKTVPADDEYYKKNFFRYEDYTYNNNIKTILLYKNGFELAPPLIQLGSDEPPIPPPKRPMPPMRWGPGCSASRSAMNPICITAMTIRPSTYTYAQFLAEWQTYATAINNAVPGWAITNAGNGWTLTGPASASNTQGYTVPFAGNEAGVISMVTQHYYRGNGQSPSSTVAFLLLPDSGLG